MPDPISKGSCVLWLKANDASTIHATSNAVDTWDDKSGNGKNATATTTARPTTGTRTINGKNALDFDGVANVLSVPALGLASPYTICAVALNDSGANGVRQQLVGGVTIAYALEKNTSNQWILSAGSGLSNGTADTAAHLFVALVKSGTNGVLRVDATEATGQPGTGSVSGGGMKVGAGNSPAALFWNGLISEIIIYSVELNSTDRAAMAAYLTSEWFYAGTARTLAGKAQIANGAKQGSVLHYR